MKVLTADGAWPSSLSVQLREARERRGDSQTQCAVVLVELGALPPPTQSDVSKWERGVKPRTLSRRLAVRGYVEVDEGPRLTLVPSEGERTHAGERIVTSHEVRDPAAAAEAIVQRFRNGPPLSPDDRAILDWMIRFNRLDET